MPTTFGREILGREVLEANHLEHAIERIAKLETLDNMAELTGFLRPAH